MAAAGILGLVTLASFRLEIEPNHSTIGFSIPIAAGMTKVTGKFTGFEVGLIYDPEDPSKWSISAAIDAATIVM